METIILVWLILLLGLFPPAYGDDNVLVYMEPSSCLLSRNESFSGIRLGCVKCQWDIRTKNDSRSTPELRKSEKQ